MKNRDRIIVVLIIVVVFLSLILIYSRIVSDIKKDYQKTLTPYEYVVLINQTMSDLESNKARLIDLQRLTYGDVDLQRLHLLKIEAVEIMIDKDRKSIDELKVELNKLKIK